MQLVVVAVLVASGAASSLILAKEFSSNLVRDGRTELDRPSFLSVAIPCALLTSIMFMCSIGAVWLFVAGWEGFEKALLISAGSGLVMGAFIGTLSYLAGIAGRRHWEKIEMEMDKIIKTKRPVPQRTKRRAAFGIMAVVFGTLVFDVFASGFSAYEPFWHSIFLLEAVFWGVFGLLALVPSWSYVSSNPISDPGVKLWVIVMLVSAAILLSLYFAVPLII